MNETLRRPEDLIQQRGQLSIREGRWWNQVQTSIWGRTKVRIESAWSPAQCNSHHIANADNALGLSIFRRNTAPPRPTPHPPLSLGNSFWQEANAAANYQAFRIPIWVWVQASELILKTVILESNIIYPHTARVAHWLSTGCVQPTDMSAWPKQDIAGLF